MKKLVFLVLPALIVINSPMLHAQWIELYSTFDDSDNGTGNRTASVGVIGEDNFVALVTRTGASAQSYLIPYVNADSAMGRVYTNGYGGSANGVFQQWIVGFDLVTMNEAWSIAVTPDSLIYLANNDPDHNILVFKFESDTINAAPYRTTTGTNPIFGIDVDQNGYVYVTNDSSFGVTDDVKVFPPVADWSILGTTTPVQTIDLPDGVYRGITVSGNGGLLFVADYANRRINKYVGSPSTGYTMDMNFNFQLAETDTVPGAFLTPSVLGVGYLSPNNLLFAAVDAFLEGGAAYHYGRIYVIDPNTGSLVGDSTVHVIDAAQWNLDQTGAFNNRPDGTIPGNASGYTSTYDVDFDENGNLYSQSYYGWTVEKWMFQGTLPTVTSVREISSEIPSSYSLTQNYPNPFNPTTTIEFSVTETEHVTLKVYDVLGREVALLVKDTYAPGTYRLTFEASQLASGIYVYTLTAGEFVSTKKMSLVK